MSSTKKSAKPYVEKTGSKKSAPERATARIRQKALAAVDAPLAGDLPNTERDDTTLADVFPVPPARTAEVNADPDRVPLSQAMKKPGKSKGGKKPAAAKPVKAPKAVAEPKTKKMSGLDAAAQVLATAKKPLNAKDLIAAMAEQKLWTSPGGKTPHSTLYAAMLREINDKGKDARFKKVERGLFTIA